MRIETTKPGTKVSIIWPNDNKEHGIVTIEDSAEGKIKCITVNDCSMPIKSLLNNNVKVMIA